MMTAPTAAASKLRSHAEAKQDWPAKERAAGVRKCSSDADGMSELVAHKIVRSKVREQGMKEMLRQRRSLVYRRKHANDEESYHQEFVLHKVKDDFIPEAKSEETISGPKVW